MFKRHLLSIAISAWLAAAGPVAAAQSLVDPRPADIERNDGTAVSLDQAVSMVQSRFHAKAVKAETVDESGHAIHYIRLVSADKSRVWTVRVDAATGRIY